MANTKIDLTRYEGALLYWAQAALVQKIPVDSVVVLTHIDEITYYHKSMNPHSTIYHDYTLNMAISVTLPDGEAYTATAIATVEFDPDKFTIKSITVKPRSGRMAKISLNSLPGFKSWNQTRTR